MNSDQNIKRDQSWYSVTIPPKKRDGRCNAITRSVSKTKVKIAELQAQMDELKDVTEAERQAAEQEAQTAGQDNGDDHLTFQQRTKGFLDSCFIMRFARGIDVGGHKTASCGTWSLDISL